MELKKNHLTYIHNQVYLFLLCLSLLSPCVCFLGSRWGGSSWPREDQLHDSHRLWKGRFGKWVILVTMCYFLSNVSEPAQFTWKLLLISKTWLLFLLNPCLFVFCFCFFLSNHYELNLRHWGSFTWILLPAIFCCRIWEWFSIIIY